MSGAPDSAADPRDALAPIDCEGAPRDVGFAQGAGCSSVLRSDYGALPLWTRLAHRLGRVDAHTAHVARDLRRHFPHQSESIEGIARGAGVPASWLSATLAHQLAVHPPRWTGGVVAVPARRPPEALAARYLAARVSPHLVVRRSRPDGNHRSIEVTLPWLTSALGGVNEVGLAVTCVPGGRAPGDCTAPALLLVHDCLARFGSVEGALDWLVGRPAGGRAILFVGDASGEVAGVEILGDERRVLRPSEGVLVEAGGGGREAEISKRLRESPPNGIDALEGCLADGGVALRLVVLDPADRRLGVRDALGDRRVRWFPV